LEIGKNNKPFLSLSIITIS